MTDSFHQPVLCDLQELPHPPKRVHLDDNDDEDDVEEKEEDSVRLGFITRDQLISLEKVERGYSCLFTFLYTSTLLIGRSFVHQA